MKELIKQSGFPLQIEIGSFLEEARVSMDLKDMEVSTSTYYLDKETKKGRDLDIKVEVPIRYEGMAKGKASDQIGAFLKLLIQCKRIPGNVWVFFKTSHEIFSRPQCTSVLDSLEWIPRLHSDFAFLPNLHYKHIPATTIYDEYILDENKTNKRVDNLFQGIISLAKATYGTDTDVWVEWDSSGRYHPPTGRPYYPYGGADWSIEMRNTLKKYLEVFELAKKVRAEINSLVREKKMKQAQGLWDSA